MVSRAAIRGAAREALRESSAGAPVALHESNCLIGERASFWEGKVAGVKAHVVRPRARTGRRGTVSGVAAAGPRGSGATWCTLTWQPSATIASAPYGCGPLGQGAGERRVSPDGPAGGGLEQGDESER